MEDYNRQIKKISSYVKNTKSSLLDLEGYLRFEVYGLILDFDSISEDFFQSHPEILVNTIYAIKNIKKELEHNRPHTKEKKTKFEIFKKTYAKQISQGRIYDFSKKVFDLFFSIVCEYSLKPLDEAKIKKDIHIFSNFLMKNFEEKEIYNILFRLIEDAPDYLNVKVYDFLDSEKIDILKKTFIKATRSSELSTCLIQTMCSVYMGLKKDTLIENHILYYLFTSYLDCFSNSEYERVVLLDPSPFFVKKWMMDSELNEVDCLLIYTNEYLADFWNIALDSKLNMNCIAYSELDNLIPDLQDTSNKIFVFGNHINDRGLKYYVLQKLVKNMAYNIFCLFDYDQNTLKDFEARKIFHGNDLKDLFLFPSGINDIRNRQRSSLLVFKSGNTDTKFKMTHYTLLKDGEYQSLSPKLYSLEMDQNIFFDGEDSIRNIFNTEFKESNRKTEQKKNIAYSFRFSEEIVINYTATIDQKTNRYRVDAYVTEPRFSKDGNRDFSTKVRLTSTVKRTRKTTMAEIKEWLNEEYPYSYVLKKGESKIDVRSEICSKYKDAYKNKPITLKTFVYFKRNLVAKYGENQMKILTKLCDTVLGKTVIDNVSSVMVNETLNDIFIGENDENKMLQAKAILSDVIDQAIKEKHASRNAIKQEVLEEKKSRDKAYYQSREHLTIKYFSELENMKLYKNIKKNLVNDERYLGAYIKLVTGLESNIVCGLQWKDFVLLHDYNMQQDKYQLIIRKQLCNDGSQYVGFSSKELYRRIPCSKELTVVLLKQKQNLVEKLKLTSSSEVDELPIVMGEGMGVISPSKLSSFCGKMVKKLRSGYSIISEIPDSKKGTIETDFLSYGGDIFRSNYQHYGLYKAGFNQGELDYLLGRKTDTPFARNYCDFGNDAAQMVLGVKQNRLMGIFKEDKLLPTKSFQYIPETQKPIEYISDSSSTSIVNIVATISLSAQDIVSLEVKSKHGFDLSIKRIERIQ